MDVVDSFIAGLYVLMESEYTSFEPSGTAIDSIYYSLDTIVTNGAGRVIPVTARTKTIGFFIFRNLRISVTV